LFHTAWLHGEPRGPKPMSAANGALNLSDIQGFILRGYRMPMVRHFLVAKSARPPRRVRACWDDSSSGDESDRAASHHGGKTGM